MRGGGKDLPGRGTESGIAYAHSYPEHKQVPHGLIPTPRGSVLAQGQVQRSEERAGSSSVFMWGKAEWPRGGKINSSSHLSLTGRAAGATDPMGDQGGGTQPKASKESPALPRPAPPCSPSSLPGCQRACSLFLTRRSLSSISQTFVSSCSRAYFSESCRLEQATFLTAHSEDRSPTPPSCSVLIC